MISSKNFEEKFYATGLKKGVIMGVQVSHNQQVGHRNTDAIKSFH